MPRRSGGYTIIEMLAALVLSAVAIAAVGMLGFRQQRFHRDVVTVSERLEQLEQAAAMVPIALRSLAPGEGDIPSGGARDTSLEFRATIATAVVCDTAHGQLSLAPVTALSPHLASSLTRPDVGDTAWVLLLAGAGENWAPRPITAVRDSVGACPVGGTSPWSGPPQHSLNLKVSGSMPEPGGAVRITRPWRYSVYRASDGFWYLGAKDWNVASAHFNTIQPIAGPFTSAASGGVALSYFDSLGVAVASGSANTRAIALIQIGFRVDSALPGKYRHAIGIPPTAIARVALRNRAR